MLKKLSYVALLLLIGLGACRKQFLEPHKKGISNQQIEILKQWHSQNPTTWKLLTPENQAQSRSVLDSLPFFPIWEEAVIQTSDDVEGLGWDSKIIVVPMERSLGVAYTDQFDMIRRLRVVMNGEEVVKAHIIQIMTLRGTLLRTESLLMQDVDNPKLMGFTGIIFEYDLHFNPIKNRFWINGQIEAENLPTQQTMTERLNGCVPLYNSVWIPSCPNIGQPGHTGAFCGHNEGHWENMLIGFDCSDNAGVGNQTPTVPTNPPTTGGNTGGGASPTTPPTPTDPGHNLYDPVLEAFSPNYLPPNFKDSLGLYRAYKQTLLESYQACKTTERNGGFAKNKTDSTNFYKYRDELEKAVKEIETIEKSTFQYDFVLEPYTVSVVNGKTVYGIHGKTDYNPVTKRIQVNMPQTPPNQNKFQILGVGAHEMKHVYQFETGKISFKKTGGAGILSDLGDEVAGYQRQYIIDYFKYYGKVNIDGGDANNFEVNEQTLLAYARLHGIDDYLLLPRENLTIFTNEEGVSLQLLGINAPDIFVKP